MTPVLYITAAQNTKIYDKKKHLNVLLDSLTKTIQLFWTDDYQCKEAAYRSVTKLLTKCEKSRNLS